MVGPRALTVVFYVVAAAAAASTATKTETPTADVKRNDVGNRLEALTRVSPADQQVQQQLSQHRRFRHEASSVRVLYQNGNSEDELPVCEKWAVCSKVDMYQWPWVERQCRCPPGTAPCSQMLSPADGHTITDKTRQFKLCEPIKMLPKCRYFRDMAWTLRSEGNGTLQTVHCHCPKGSVAYLLKRQAYQTESKQIGYQYSFACSPQSRLRCQRKEPCRLFTVRKRQEMVDEVNTNSLCQCPQEHACPSHHTDAGVIQSKNYSEENIRTYSGYCMPLPADD
ncbi:protein giant-lens [Daktulosphaira vitifoliae]|uniref:protein giant-lens n=1 Tax=Daktulosphaira vitifoliae TaxID=58002 RepID=UPI0021AA687A|nr:protein giant-lens [Daktulosphaira vitifoliae]